VDASEIAAEPGRGLAVDFLDLDFRIESEFC
jgi:hypothetical protein